MKSHAQMVERNSFKYMGKQSPYLALAPESHFVSPKQILLSIEGSSLPFSLDDTTAGIENEFQAAVIGNNETVDLPNAIANSSYFKNIIKKAKSGDSPRQVLTSLEDFLEEENNNVWENSWVRFPRKYLSPRAEDVFQRDLLADKSFPALGTRSDIKQFSFVEDGELQVRIPISYLLKLALADVTGLPNTPNSLSEIADKLMGCFLSDNTSPEVTSFYITPLSKKFGKGRSVADEALLRYLSCQLLIQYANKQFNLTESGQKARIYFAPNPPVRQRKLNELIPDSFYRELFMSPCLSGWDKGEEKHQYMGFCHRTLSNSQLNAVYKLKEAGIISTNLVVLPNTSNTSLANNGTHVSLGSDILSKVLSDPASGFSAVEEKYFGDLVIKITEHFLPLFVGQYSGAPYRLDFWDFHPEKVLGYLPHQLDYTHLRMLWRRWKKKAHLKFLGRRFTPFGPELFDRIFSVLAGVKGDFVSDYRLIDYFISLLSTEHSPALSGKLGNDEKLKNDLATMGVFDQNMATYLLCRMRQYATMGYSGFEARYYSQFEQIGDDLGEAVNLQVLINALAYKYVLNNQFCHFDIPDSPSIESERRQVFFGSAIGIPTFFVQKDTENRFLRRILEVTERKRASRRYNGYIRVYNHEYKRALLRVIRDDAKDLIEMMGMEPTLNDLQMRLDYPDDSSVSGKLTKGILAETGSSKVMKLSGEEFNTAAETYYRETLRKKQIDEAFMVLQKDAMKMVSPLLAVNSSLYKKLELITEGKSVVEFIKGLKKDALEEALPLDKLVKLIQLTLMVVDSNKQFASANKNTSINQQEANASVY